jgi:hypothetical protein
MIQDAALLTISVRIGPWSVETLDPTYFAERVFGLMRVERVSIHLVSTLKKEKNQFAPQFSFLF